MQKHTIETIVKNIALTVKSKIEDSLKVRDERITRLETRLDELVRRFEGKK